MKGKKAIKPNVPKYEHATNYKMRKLSDLYVVGGVWHSTHCLTEKKKLHLDCSNFLDRASN